MIAGACQAISSQGKAPDPNMYTGPWVNIHHGLEGGYRDILSTYWQGCLRHLEDADHNYKEHQLPLARIKKVMKADEEVKMISAEAPILFAKGCDIFITELTMRAWIHAEENKRRTLQRSDIAAALTKSDMFDFLIDIVPREESAGASHAKRPQAGGVTQSTATQPQAQQQAQHHAPNQHHPGPEYGGFPSHMPQEQDFRTQPGMYGVPPGQSDASGYPAAPPHMFDQNMYAGYGLPPQQVSRYHAQSRSTLQLLMSVDVYNTSKRTRTNRRPALQTT